MMDIHFLRYQIVLGTACDDINLILSSHFSEAFFAATWRARLIGADALSETIHTRCAVYLWTALQTHMVLKCYIEMCFC
jgi:hypothetical protein